MILGLITLIISFYLEGIVSNFIGINTNLFSPLFTVVSLIIVYPYFYNKEDKYLMYLFLLGLLYDLAYTNTLGLNAIVFVLLGLFIKKINTYISSNIVNNVFKGLIIIIIYRLITYILLLFIGYIEVNFNLFIKSITSSLILNIIYLILINIVTNYISKKKHIVRID